MDLSKAIAFCRPGAAWSLAGDTYEGLEWHDQAQAKPTEEELQAAWDDIQSQRGWPNVQAFMASFTMPEIAAVSLSTDPTIAALRLTLSTWLGRVEVPDLRVQTGLNKMVELGIISADRKAEIEAQAT